MSNLFRPIVYSLALVFCIGEALINHPALSVTPITEEQIILQEGRATLTGEEGNYVAKILINASAENTWKVLTDYNNFSKFLPTVTEVKLLEEHGNQKVYEQTNVVQILFFSQSSKITIGVTETYPSSVHFQLKKADTIKSLKGSWRIESIKPNQVLVTNEVQVEPTSSVPRSIFFNIYSDTIANTLTSIKQETEKRFPQK